VTDDFDLSTPELTREDLLVIDDPRFTGTDVTVDAVADLFEAVEINGHHYWDGLFSQNPPINDLMHQPPERKPDELWVIQIDPQTFEGVSTSVESIADRRNELSGNIPLNQELRLIERVNDWVEDGILPSEEFSVTDVRRINMGRRYHCSTKLDRDPEFIEELLELGRERTGEFYESHVTLE